MKELGQLEARHADFASRGVRIIAVSNDKIADAKATQDEFPNIVIISDEQQELARAVDVIHAGKAPGGADTNAPTTFLVESGYVRWLFRPERFITRMSPQELLSAVNATWK
jgi:peroxiredoxin